MLAGLTTRSGPSEPGEVPRHSGSEGAGGVARRGSRSGFTLVEVIITLVIIGIMAAAALPALLGDDRRTDMDAATESLEKLFRMARDSAVLSSGEVLVTIDSVSGAVWFETRGGMAAAPSAPAGGGGLQGLGGPRISTRLGGIGKVEPPTPGRPVQLELPASVRMEVPRARAMLLFGPGGGVMGDSILLRSSRGEVRTLKLDPWNGRLRQR